MKIDETDIKKLIEKGEINNKEYREIFGITDRTALRDLNVICEKGIFQRIGTTGRETKYTITRHKPDINPTNTLKTKK